MPYRKTKSGFTNPPWRLWEIPDVQKSKSAKPRYSCTSSKLSHFQDKKLIQHVFVPIGTILLFYGLITLYMIYLQFKKTFSDSGKAKVWFFLKKTKKNYFSICISKKSITFVPVKNPKNASKFDQYLLVVALTNFWLWVDIAVFIDPETEKYIRSLSNSRRASFVL